MTSVALLFTIFFCDFISKFLPNLAACDWLASFNVIAGIGLIHKPKGYAAWETRESWEFWTIGLTPDGMRELL